MSKSKSRKAGHEPDHLAVRLQALRFGNAAGKHDPRPNRERTRAAAKARAMREQ